MIGLHNYGDVNRKRTRYTASMIRTAHHYNPRTRIWLTETGGIVNFGRSFPYSLTRASHRLSTMFSIAKRFRRSGIERVYVYNWTGAAPALTIFAAGGIAVPAAAPASSTQRTLFQAPRELLGADPALRARTLAELRGLGVRDLRPLTRVHRL